MNTMDTFAEKYASTTPAQRAMVDMVLAVNPDDMTAFQKTQLVLMAAAYATVNIADLKLVKLVKLESEEYEKHHV